MTFAATWWREQELFPPVGVEEDVDERGGDGRQRGGVQRHDTELVLRDEHRVDCGLDGCKTPAMLSVNPPH